MTPLTHFSSGFTAPLRGLRHIWARPDTWVFVVLPVTLTALAILASAWGVWSYSAALLEWVVPWPTGRGSLWLIWLRGLWRLLAILFAVGLFAVLFVSVQVLGTVLSGPFHDRLSSRIEDELGTTPADHGTDWSTVMGDIGMGIGHSILAFGLYAMVMAALFVLNLIPFLGEILYLILGTICTSVLLARELFDYPLSRRRTGFVDKLRYLWARKWTGLGIGFAATLLLAVPMLNLVMMSIAVAGATLLFADEEREQGPERLPSPPLPR